MRRRQLILDDTGSVEGIYAFIYCTKWRSGQVLPMPDSLTDSQTLKDRATQLLTKYKSGALVTQIPAVYLWRVKDKLCKMIMMEKYIMMHNWSHIW